MIKNIIFLFFISINIFGQGSIALLDRVELFTSSPQLTKDLFQNYYFEGTCSGLRLGRQWSHLSGARIGPYECEAYKAQDFSKVTISFYTITSFLDENGISLADEDIYANATSYTEVLTEVLVN